MSSVCLISPGHLSTNPRLVKEAEALAKAGFSVFVISACYSQWGIDADTTCCSSVWRWLAAIPFGPLAPLSIRLRHVFVQQFARFLWCIGVRHHRVAVAAWHPLCGDLASAAKTCRADLYIAHYPAALPAAALAASLHQARYAFDAEDFHLGDLPNHSRFEVQREILRTIESRWLPGASYVTAASPGIARAYAATYGLALPIVVRNVFPLCQAPVSSSARGSVSTRPSLYWFSQTIGPNRGLECAVRAIALARCKPHLHLRGIVSSSYAEQLTVLARGLGVDHCLHFHPPAPPNEMERLASAYDLGLVSETGWTVNRRIALTNKLFTYVLAGLPMVLSDIPAHREVKAELGETVRLFKSEDPDSLAESLDYFFYDSPSVLASARAAAFRLGQEQWNWDREQFKLLELIYRLFRSND